MRKKRVQIYEVIASLFFFLLQSCNTPHSHTFHKLFLEHHVLWFEEAAKILGGMGLLKIKLIKSNAPL